MPPVHYPRAKCRAQRIRHSRSQSSVEQKQGCSDMMIPAGTAGKGEHPQSDFLHLAFLLPSHSPCLPRVWGDNATWGSPGWGISLSHHTNISHLLFNPSLFYYILAVCSELAKLSPMVRFQDCCRVNITKKNLCLLGREDSISQGC